MRREGVGRGAGPIPSALCFEGCQLYALDPLHRKYLLSGFPQHFYPDVHFIDAPAEEVPIADHFFDAIISVNAIDHVDNLEAVAKELERIAKPGAKFAMLGHTNIRTTQIYAKITHEKERRDLSALAQKLQGIEQFSGVTI